MIEFFKIKSLPRRQRIHKVIKLLEIAEYSIANELKNELLDSFYLKQLFSVVLDDVDDELKNKITQWNAELNVDGKRKIINEVRHSLYELTGYSPSEWDLILPASIKPIQEELKDFRRSYFSNLYVYAEDIRTPFNIGSIFRTAESFGVEKLFLSPHCTSPLLSKAQRVAMGAVDYMEWEHVELADLPKKPIIVLETGGIDISDFVFPEEGIAVLGNEELGVSSDMLKKADAVVSIPMFGIKASLNVSVAFGILMQKWTEALRRCIKPT